RESSPLPQRSPRPNCPGRQLRKEASRVAPQSLRRRRRIGTSPRRRRKADVRAGRKKSTRRKRGNRRSTRYCRSHQQIRQSSARVIAGRSNCCSTAPTRCGIFYCQVLLPSFTAKCEFVWRSRDSSDLDVGRLDDFPPFFGVGGNEITKFGARHR